MLTLSDSSTLFSGILKKGIGQISQGLIPKCGPFQTETLSKYLQVLNWDFLL